MTAKQLSYDGNGNNGYVHQMRNRPQDCGPAMARLGATLGLESTLRICSHCAVCCRLPKSSPDGFPRGGIEGGPVVLPLLEYLRTTRGTK